MTNLKIIITPFTDKIRKGLIGNDAFLLTTRTFDERIKLCIEKVTKIIHDAIDKF